MNHKLLSEIEEYLDSIEHNARGLSFARSYKQAQTCIKTVVDCKEAVLSLFQKLDREYWELREQFEQAQKRIRYLEDDLRNCGYSDTDLDNDFLWEFQDKQAWEVDD